MAKMLFLSVKISAKSFGDLQVLKKSVLTYKGKRFAILGPSAGSGKSTILCINQLEYDSGEIDYMGKPVNSVRHCMSCSSILEWFSRDLTFYPYECAAECDRGTGSCEKSPPKQGGNCKGKRFAENGWAEGAGKRQWLRTFRRPAAGVAIHARAMAMSEVILLMSHKRTGSEAGWRRS